MTDDTQNNISEGYFAGSDLGEREEQIVREVTKLTDFRPDKVISRSSWWGSAEIGAFHYLGSYQG